MAIVSFDRAQREFLDLLEVLDDAYWEAASCEDKDRFYNLISSLQREVQQILRLDPDEMDAPYQCLSEDMGRITVALADLEANLTTRVRRSRTFDDLSRILSTVVLIVADDADYEPD